MPACMRLGRSGSRSRARAMATKAKPSASAISTVASSVMPPRRMRGVDSARSELAGVGEEEGLLVGVRPQEAVADEAEAEPDGPGSVAPNSCSGASPRKRYIGLASELPPVSSNASSAPSASKSAATATLSSSQRPPSTPSAMLSLAVTATSGPGRVAHGAQDGAGEAGAVLHRSAELVVAPVELGAQERAQQVVVADVDLDAVEAGLRRPASAARAVVLGDALDAGRRRPRAGACPWASGRPRARGRGAVGAGVGHRAGVADLGRRGRALGVHGVGQTAQARDGRPRSAAGSGGRCAPRARRPGRPRWRVAAPPAATRRWKSMRSSLTVPPGVTPSKVAALMMRLRRVSGPSGRRREDGRDGVAGGCGGGMGLPLPTAASAARRRQARRQAHARRWPARGCAGGLPTPQLQVGTAACGCGDSAGVRGGLRMVRAASTPPAAQTAPEMQHGGAEAVASCAGCERGGPGQAGQERQHGHGQEAGGPGHDVVDGRSDAGVLGRRRAHGGGGQRGDGDGQPDGEEEHGREDLGPVAAGIGGPGRAGRARRRRRAGPTVICRRGPMRADERAGAGEKRQHHDRQREAGRCPTRAGCSP